MDDEHDLRTLAARCQCSGRDARGKLQRAGMLPGGRQETFAD